MEPEDSHIEDLDNIEELAEPDDATIDFDHFDEHMDPFDDGAYYRTIDEL